MVLIVRVWRASPMRSVALMVMLALMASACGVSRSDETAIQVTEEQSVPDDPTPPVDGTDPTVDSVESGPPVTALPPLVEIPSRGEADQLAATVELTNGQTVDVTFGELDTLVQSAVTSQQYSLLTEPTEQLDTQLLLAIIRNKLIEARLEELVVEVSEDAIGESRDEIEGFLSEQLAASVGEQGERLEQAKQLIEEVDLLEFVIESSANNEALTAALAADLETVEAPCVRHIQFAPADKEGAEETLEELETGADFASVAQQRSMDQQTGPEGGAFPCGDPELLFGQVPDFLEAVEGATDGEVVGPIETTVGWHLILLDGTAPVVAGAEEGQLPQSAEEAAAAELNTTIDTALSEATVTIDPALGTFSAETLEIVPAS